MEIIKNFKELRIWQKAMEIARDVYRISKQFPKEEIYGLTAQIRRSAISIPSNIAEGFKRFHCKEQKQFLSVAQGSAAELETQLILSAELDFMTQQQFESINDKIDHLSRMISVAIRKF